MKTKSMTYLKDITHLSNLYMNYQQMQYPPYGDRLEDLIAGAQFLIKEMTAVTATFEKHGATRAIAKTRVAAKAEPSDEKNAEMLDWWHWDRNCMINDALDMLNDRDIEGLGIDIWQAVQGIEYDQQDLAEKWHALRPDARYNPLAKYEDYEEPEMTEIVTVNIPTHGYRQKNGERCVLVPSAAADVLARHIYDGTRWKKVGDWGNNAIMQPPVGTQLPLPNQPISVDVVIDVEGMLRGYLRDELTTFETHNPNLSMELELMCIGEVRTCPETSPEKIVVEFHIPGTDYCRKITFDQEVTE